VIIRKKPTARKYKERNPIKVSISKISICIQRIMLKANSVNITRTKTIKKKVSYDKCIMPRMKESRIATIITSLIMKSMKPFKNKSTNKITITTMRNKTRKSINSITLIKKISPMRIYQLGRGKIVVNRSSINRSSINIRIKSRIKKRGAPRIKNKCKKWRRVFRECR
jgi:hypothetical protein